MSIVQLEDCDDRCALLMEYASGALDEAQSLLVASYITLSPQARRYVEQCEALGGALIESHCEPVPVSEDCLQNVLARLEDEMEEEPSCALAVGHDFPEKRYLPVPLCQKIKTPVQWTPVGNGVKTFDVMTSECRKKALLLKMKPGTKVLYRKKGTMLVLEGSLSDGEHVYRRGDLLILDKGNDYRFTADREKGCFCISVAEGTQRSVKVRHTHWFSWFVRSS